MTETNGDLEARCVVRLNELLVSCFAIRTIVDNLPENTPYPLMPEPLESPIQENQQEEMGEP